MVQTTFKWKCVVFSSLVLFNVFAHTIPTANNIRDSVEPKLIEDNEKNTVLEEVVNATRDGSRVHHIARYDIEITPKKDFFDGRVTLRVQNTGEDRDLVLHAKDLLIKSVKIVLSGSTNGVETDFYLDDDLLYIFIPNENPSAFIAVIDYSGKLPNGGHGLYLGQYNQNSYLAMNLHPTYARRVFPCMDEPTQNTDISFTFNNLEYTNVVMNTELEENSVNQYRPLNGPPHLWGMVAHDFANINIPVTNVFLYGRQGVSNQDSVSSIAINFFFNNLNEWTNKEYTGIITNQDGRMSIVVVPDVATDWHALSSVVIWEPYVFMESAHSVKQRSIALPKIAEAMARQWFGYVVYPEKWQYQWIVEGLAIYTGWEMLKLFQGDGMITDTTILDVNTLFTTEVIQESLLRDSYLSSKVLEPGFDLSEEEAIRDHIGVNGIVKYKAPALMRMMRVVLGNADNDYIQKAGRALVNRLSGEPVNSLDFIDAVNSEWIGSNNNEMVGHFDEYLEPWIQNNGYPLIRVTRIRGTGVLLSQERFGFSNKPFVPFSIPVTYTTSLEKNFELEKIYPVKMVDTSQLLVFDLGEEDWVIFNIQGQGYYRVNYDNEMWDIIIKTLEDPVARKEIHPLNRATLIDDVLNIARAGRIDYDLAFKVVLTMEHETEYAPWRAFVRNMDFLRKRLVAYVDANGDLDGDIYLKMVGKTIQAFENEIGFHPGVSLNEPTMQSLTRGLVMDHACRANYQPCIAAAVDWFYDTSNPGVVNPNIPHEIRPAVYCTMVREGDGEVIEALEARLEIEPTQYERIVILQSLACSQNEDYINGLLDQTISGNSPYLVEERVKIFTAVAESSYQNANLARAFLRRATAEIRERYGGPAKLEEVIFVLADNMADPDQIEQFQIFVNDQNNNLEDSQDAAQRAFQQTVETLVWDTRDKEYVYELIHEIVRTDDDNDIEGSGGNDNNGSGDNDNDGSGDGDNDGSGDNDNDGSGDNDDGSGDNDDDGDENHAPTLVVSVMAFCVSLMVALLNH